MSRRSTVALAPLSLALLLGGCGEGVLPFTGAAEPVQVSGGQFFHGPFPVGTGPKVGTVNAPSTTFDAGMAGLGLTGDVDPGAFAVAVGFADLGSGYWSVPVGPPDVNQGGGQLSWSASCNFSASIPPGKHDLLFTGIDGAGNPGPSNALTLTLLSSLPAGKEVISLAWDSGADLDLHLVAPDGTELDPQHPNTYAGTDGVVPLGIATLDRDSNGSCVSDGSREEDAVFTEAPVPGTYLVRVDMFSACGAAAADFVLTRREDGAVAQTVKGRLLAQDADGGGPGSGLFVAQFTCDPQGHCR